MAVEELLASRVIYLQPLVTEVQLLSSRAIYLDPLEPPPEAEIELLDSRAITLEPLPETDGFQLSGVITSVGPTVFAFGDPVDLVIDFQAYCESLYYQIRGWWTRLVAELDGLSDSDSQWHYGREGHRTGETLNLGAMPNRHLSGSLILQGRGATIPLQPWQELDRKALTITLTGAPPPPPPPPPPPDEEKEFPWPWVLIGGGAAITTIGLASAAKEKRR